MTKVLDDMQVHFKGEGKTFNRVYLKNLTECLAMWGDELSIPSQNLGWKGFLGYWKSNGTKVDYRGLPDYWGECSNTEFGNQSDCMNEEYYRFKPEPFGKENMLIFEPCNYVSNVAYYHSATRIC